MKHIRQPKDSNLCGQACVAMILDITLEDAIKRVGKKGKTRTKDIVGAVGEVAQEARLVPVRQRPTLPKRALTKVTWTKGQSHWVVFWDGMVFDPSLDQGHDHLSWAAYIADIPGARVTSTLKLM